MDADHSWLAIEQQRLAIAGLLDELDHTEWEHPSLCEGWRVREVAAHLVQGTTAPSIGLMIREGLRARGDFDRMNSELARQGAERPTAEIAAALRDRAASRELPVVTNHRNALFDVVVHGQDIALPLDRGLAVPVEVAAEAAENLWRLRWPWSTRRRFRGLAFEATDAGWSAGAGPVVRGPILDLLLALAARPIVLPELSGDGVPELGHRIGSGAARAPEWN